MLSIFLNLLLKLGAINFTFIDRCQESLAGPWAGLNWGKLRWQQRGGWWPQAGSEQRVLEWGPRVW